MHEVDGVIRIEKSDQCHRCRFNGKTQRLCPLLEALALGVVSLQQDMVVQNCDFFQKPGRHLKAIT